MNQQNESQQQRAEQNRLKALQIRQQRLAALGCSGPKESTPGPPQPLPGASPSAPQPPHANNGPKKFTPPLAKPPSGNSVPAPGDSPVGVKSTKFYAPHSSTSSGGFSLPSNGIKTPGNCPPRFTASRRQPPLSAGVSGPPFKQPRIEATNKTTSDSNFPPEVLKRIEESKRKAQERKEALKRGREQGLNVLPPPPAPSPHIPSSRQHPQPIRQPIPSSISDKKNATVPSVSAAPRAKQVTVTFTLTSITMFQATTSKFHSATIEVFKTMASRNYDYKTRVWSFQTSEHKKLVVALRPLHPEVEVQPLPQFVLMAVEAAVKKVPAEYIDLFGLDVNLRDDLMPFQEEGVKFGISLGGRVLLADDMGLGKTIQALGIACHYRSEWPLLVVTPSSMRYSWEESILRWVNTVSGDEVRVMTTGNDHFKEAKVVVLSYDLLSRQAERMLNHNFGVVILDESHMIKSYKSARYKAAAPLMKKLKRVIMLSGTPAMSRPIELYTQISGIDPSLFPQVQDYGVRYCAGHKEAWGWSFRGSSNTEELQIILQSCVWIRRLKSEVLSQLPPKQRMTVVLDPSLIKTSQKSYEEMSQKFKSQSLSSLQDTDHFQLFIKTAEAKVVAVRQYLKEVLESGRKFLVFAHHKVMMENLCSLCVETKTKFIRIDGRTPPEERNSSTAKFQNNEEVKVAVLSITAANTGITLTAAQLVIFAELYWNPGILVQAEDRAHRIGQEDSVVVQYLVARKTADDHIWPLIHSKLEVLGKVGLSNDKLKDSEMSYQKSARDIRDFMKTENTDRQISPKKSAASSDIRSFMQPQKQTQNTDPNWNSYTDT